MTITKHKFSSQQYHLMTEAGVFEHIQGQRLELIKGEIIQMLPIGRNHCACIARLNKLLFAKFGSKQIIWVQSSIRLDDGSEPQPDLALLNLRSDFYEEALPAPEDILLIVEVADSTISYDRDLKMPLYAEFGIPEAWLVDVNKKTLTRYTSPSSQGYKDSQRLDINDSIPCLDKEIAATDIFGN